METSSSSSEIPVTFCIETGHGTSISGIWSHTLRNTAVDNMYDLNVLFSVTTLSGMTNNTAVHICDTPGIHTVCIMCRP